MDIGNQRKTNVENQNKLITKFTYQNNNIISPLEISLKIHCYVLLLIADTILLEKTNRRKKSESHRSTVQFSPVALWSRNEVG